MGKKSISESVENNISTENENNGASENLEGIYVVMDGDDIQNCEVNRAHVENQQVNRNTTLSNAESFHRINAGVVNESHVDGPANNFQNERSTSDSNQNSECCCGTNRFKPIRRHLFKVGVISAFITLAGVVVFVYGLLSSLSFATIAGIAVFLLGILSTCALFPIYYWLQKCDRHQYNTSQRLATNRMGPNARYYNRQVVHPPPPPSEYDPPPFYSTIPLPASLSSPVSPGQHGQSSSVFRDEEGQSQSAKDLPPSYHDAAKL